MPEAATFGDLGELFDGPHATPTRRSSGPYFLNISSLDAGRLNLAASDHVSEDDYARWTRRVTPREGDLLFSYETRLGEAALMPGGVRACLGRRMALLRPDRSRVDPRFLLYYYLSPAFQATIRRNAIHGATVDRIGLSTMGEWLVDLPPLSEQRGIAEVLGALDDKIAGNDRAIGTSEELAVALASTGLRLRPLGDVTTRQTESVNPAVIGDTHVDLFSLPAFDDGCLPENVVASTIKSNKVMLRQPCVLLTKLNPRIPRVWNIPQLGDSLSLASPEFLALTPNTCSSSVLWSVLCQPRFLGELASLVAGTSGSHQRVRPEEVMRLNVTDPDSVDAEVRSAITALGTKVLKLRAESRTLAETRDALLPLLMSGRVRVNQERTVEGVV